jgi:hypothetical protein
MLGNIIGGFIVILVGTALLPTVNFIAHQESNFSMHNPEYRLKSLRGQDRSVTSQYARTTDKGFPLGYSKEGYTVWSHDINKTCVNTNEHSKSVQHKLMVT